MTEPSTITSAIPLARLTVWSGNVRKTGILDGLDELKSSIAAHGLLQSLVVRKASRGRYEVIAGQRRLLALQALVADGIIERETPIPCHVAARDVDGAEISLAENAVRLPMHPADQFEAFRELIDKGSTPADVAARFGVSEQTVLKRLKLARVSPDVLAAYRAGALTLEEVTAFAITDDPAAQERLLADLPPWRLSAADVRASLTARETPATDKRVRFVTLAAYEAAGGAVTRDLFSEGESGVFIRDTELLDRLAAEKLEAIAGTLRAEGWRWVEAHAEFDYEARAAFARRHPEPLPPSDEDAAALDRLAGEYQSLSALIDEEDEDRRDQLDALDTAMDRIQERYQGYGSETLAIAGAVVTIGHRGEAEILRGLIRPEDVPVSAHERQPREKPEFSAALIESLTRQRSAAIGAALSEQPAIALAAVTFALASNIFRMHSRDTSLRLSLDASQFRESAKGKDVLEEARCRWAEHVPGDRDALWEWCVSQDRHTLLSLLAFCAGMSVNTVKQRHDRPDDPRLAHAEKLAQALSLDMRDWFTPTAANYFSRVSRDSILASLAEARGKPVPRSWRKLKKAELAALAERETAATRWLPQPLKA